MSDGNSDAYWHEQAKEHGWVMPRAPWWKRTLLVRRIRYAWGTYQVERWAAAWGAFPNPYDRWVLYGIATGKERPARAALSPSPSQEGKPTPSRPSPPSDEAASSPQG
jgi:hypothetical protein